MTQISATILGCAGPRLTDDEARFFAEAQPWGFILFARNIEDPDQLRTLTEALRAAVGRDAPILIDQEGGRVQRMRAPHWREWQPPLDVVDRCQDPSRVLYLRSRLIADELREVGINVSCHPTADIARPDTHPFLRNRLMGHDADRVTKSCLAVHQGLTDGGVISVMKHLPGHGAATLDSHHDLPRVTLGRATLEAEDFAVFRALNTLRMGMTGHMVVDAVDPDLPATFSAKVIDMIRTEIKFDGLLMTDDLSMNALPGPIGERAARARAAGCDVILHCNGERAEMEAVLANCGALDGDAARRAEAALAFPPRRQALDIPATEAELADLLDGEVYG